MRDLLTTEKQERQQLDKRCEKQQGDISNLQRDKERFSSQVSELENQVIELKEQVSNVIYNKTCNRWVTQYTRK